MMTSDTLPAVTTPTPTEEPLEVKPETKSWDTKAGEAIINKAKEFAEDVGDVVSDNKDDIINSIIQFPVTSMPESL